MATIRDKLGRALIIEPSIYATASGRKTVSLDRKRLGDEAVVSL